MARNARRSQYRFEFQCAQRGCCVSPRYVLASRNPGSAIHGASRRRVLVSESLWKLTSENLGYRTDHLFMARIDLPQDARYASPASRSQFADRLQTQLNAIPGVQSVAFGSDDVPRGMHQISVAGQLEKQSSNVATQDIGASGFATLGIPLLRGRTFDARDGENAQPVAWQWQKSILISGIREEMRI